MVYCFFSRAYQHQVIIKSKVNLNTATSHLTQTIQLWLHHLGHKPEYETFMFYSMLLLKQSQLNNWLYHANISVFNQN